MKDNNFKEARQTLGLTQQKMADLCGIHRMTWVKWERGEQKPPAIARTHVKCLLWLNEQGLLDSWYKYLRDKKGESDE